MSRNGRRRRHHAIPKPAAAAQYRAPLRDDLKIYGVAALIALAPALASYPVYYTATTAAAAMHRELTALPEAHGQTAGTRAVLSGTIAADTAPLFRHFVAYTKEEHHKGGRTGVSTWKPIGGMVQQLRLLEGAREGWIENVTYRFSPGALGTAEDVLPVWDHIEARDGEEPGGAQHAVRYRGFIAGRPVTAIGTVGRQGFLTAEHVVAGTRQEVLSTLLPIARGETHASYFWWSASGLAAFTLALALLARARLKANTF